MSATADTYACEICTYIQSINRPQCEMCNAPNPSFIDQLNGSNAGAAAMMNFPTGDGIVECSKCEYINIGSDVEICEGCGSNLFFDTDGPFRTDIDDNEYSNSDSDNENDERKYDDDDDVIMGGEDNKAQANGTQQKAAEAVEKGMDNDQLQTYFNRYLLILRDQRQQTKTFTEVQLNEYLTELFQSLEYKNDQSDGQLVFPACQICYDEDETMVTMKACGHRMICGEDFHRYLSTRIRDGEILPWIPCPAESCSVPCHVDNIIDDGRLILSELLSFLTTYMVKKLSRNENFITCVQCQQGGFLQFGPPKKQQVTCTICNEKQTIEKGTDGDLDIAFKKMIKSGHLRECPTCRLLTLKEKGLCNVIECAKCGIWWNWRTREQGHDEKDLKQRARMNGTLWEPGELSYQQDLERRNPKKFKALLERNGIKYNPNYVRGNWDD